MDRTVDNTEKPVAIGIDIGGTSVKSGVLMSKGGVIAARSRVAVNVPSRAFSDLRRVVFDQLSNIAEGGAFPKGVPVGISTTGILDCDERVILAHFFQDYKEIMWSDEIRREFRDKFSVIRVMNDGNAAAWAEYDVRVDKNVHDVLHFSLGTGVGGGLICRGNLVLGVRCLAGELGHIVVVDSGRRCPCGNQGCVEAYAGTSGIIQTAIEKQRETPGTGKAYSSLRQVVQYAVAGDAAANLALETAGHYLGIAIGSLLNVFNPGYVTLGGGTVDATKLVFDDDQNPLLKAIRQMAEEASEDANWRSVSIIPAHYGNDASWIGAASYAMQS